MYHSRDGFARSLLNLHMYYRGSNGVVTSVSYANNNEMYVLGRTVPGRHLPPFNPLARAFQGAIAVCKQVNWDLNTFLCVKRVGPVRDSVH